MLKRLYEVNIANEKRKVPRRYKVKWRVALSGLWFHMSALLTARGHMTERPKWTARCWWCGSCTKQGRARTAAGLEFIRYICFLPPITVGMSWCTGDVRPHGFTALVKVLQQHICRDAARRVPQTTTGPIGALLCLGTHTC